MSAFAAQFDAATGESGMLRAGVVEKVEPKNFRGAAALPL
jgi:hypothetical protein